jgi:hypothetical protein
VIPGEEERVAREEVTDRSLNELVQRLSSQTASLVGAQGFEKLTGVRPGD